jgi:DNA modification methylase
MSRLGPFEENTIVAGDCLDIMAQMPDGCVDLVVTDPVYNDIETQGNMAGQLSRLLKPTGNAIIYAGHAFLDRLLPALSNHLRYRWIFAERTPGRDTRMFPLRLFVKWNLILWFSSNGNVTKKWCPDQYEVPSDSRMLAHPWAKNEATIGLWIRNFSNEDDLIFDPFMGSGTTAVVADRLGRKFFGCDINPDYVKMALERLEKDRAARQLELL